MTKKPGKGQVLNHSDIPLLVIETDSGRAKVHILGPKRKSPIEVDADGFRRSDGESIFLHKNWWKIVNFTTADIWQLGENLLVPTSLAIPVSDKYFGEYKIDKNLNWGEKLIYVTSIIRNRKRKVIGYIAEKFGKISKKQAIRLLSQGKLDNVVVIENAQGTIFLRSKKNFKKLDNLKT